MEKALEVTQNMAKFWYMEWYCKDIAPHLTAEQKKQVMLRISELTLDAPIWMDRKTDFTDQFPELKPYSHSGSISGLQLVSVFEAIFKELHPDVAL